MNKKITIVISLLILFCISCSNDDTDISQPVTSGNIIGYVNLYDDGVTQLENSGMKISIEETSPIISAITDSEGKYLLNNVPFGIYTLVYEKEGYGTYKKFNVEHNESQSSTIIQETPSLGKYSTTEISDLSVTITGTDVSISVSTNPDGNVGNKRYIRFFYSIDSNVGDENHINYSSTYISQINPYSLSLSQSDLASIGFSTGTTVYVKVYGESFWSNDYLSGNLRIFPNLNNISSNAVSFIVP